jgi:3',5'-cyclic AMP phosphodiesterase CpdA
MTHRLLRFAHLSDVHVLSLKGETPLSFLNKRITGLANIYLRRGPNRYPQYRLVAALETCRNLHVDHLFCTGDLTNLACEPEFRAVRNLFDRHYLSHMKCDPSEAATIIPGNHDAYIEEKSPLLMYHRYFGDAFAVPKVKLLHQGRVLVAAINSAVPRPAFVASGEIDRKQREMLESMVTEQLKHVPSAGQSQLRIALIHHPLLQDYPKNHALEADSLAWLSDFLQRHQFQLCLHGHTHVPRDYHVGMTRVIDPGSTTLTSHFNVYTWDSEKQHLTVERMKLPTHS